MPTSKRRSANSTTWPAQMLSASASRRSLLGGGHGGRSATLKVRARGSGGAARGRTRFATPFAAACWIR
jgi:hypothetical protein